MAHVPLSANTITKTSDEIAEDIEVQLLERINESPWYTIQVDKSTDVDNKATMLVLGSKRSLLNVSLCIMLAIEKC